MDYVLSSLYRRDGCQYSGTMMSIAKVAVEIALDREFDYRIPERLQGEIKLGSQVVVPFGKTEVRGYVIGLQETSPHKNLKEIRDRVGQKALIGDNILALARWIAAARGPRAVFESVRNEGQRLAAL